MLETVTAKRRVRVPWAGTVNGPVQVRVWPLLVGSAVVAPVVEPGT